jgi:hypothetical protein
MRWATERTLEQVHTALAHPLGIVLAGLDRGVGGRGELVPQLVVLDPVDGTAIHRLAPQSRHGVTWMSADPFGSLVCATAEGVELIDLVAGRRRWTNVAYDAMETPAGWLAEGSAIIESRASSLHAIDLDDGIMSEPFATAIRGNWEKDSLEHVRVEDDELIAHYRDRVLRYSIDGAILGADIISDTRDYRWLLPADARQVLVSQYDTRQVKVEGEPGRRTQRRYRVYVLSPNCKLEADMMELPPMNKRLREASLVDGWLLLSTDNETVALPL